MQGSVWSKVAVKGLPTKNGEKWRKKEKIHWKLIQMNFSADENGKIGITDLEKNTAKSRCKFLAMRNIPLYSIYFTFDSLD